MRTRAGKKPGRKHVLVGDDDGVAEEAREDAELDPGGEERPVRSDQAARERDREQEDRPGGLHDEGPRLAAGLLRVPRPILRGPGHRADKGAVAADEVAGEDRDVHVRREGAPRLSPLFTWHSHKFAARHATFALGPSRSPRVAMSASLAVVYFISLYVVYFLFCQVGVKRARRVCQMKYKMELANFEGLIIFTK